jgi:superfamily II RNA helicase
MRFKDFVLDKFQEEAIEKVELNHSVVVSAATGTGKTLIADYIINKYVNSGKRIIYTAPIKALSNQKYRDFKRDYGYDKIGLLTGDVVINPEANVLIMTTEIYRNMLMSKDEIIDNVSYVIFDEIHYINDRERGKIWEESLIFSPNHVRFLCLSATIPNAKEFAEWISGIHGHTVDVVRWDKRAVPLKHFVYDSELGLTTTSELKGEISKLDYSLRVDGGRRGRRGRRKKKTKAYLKGYYPPKHIEVIDVLEQKNFLPCFYFSFSRQDCEDKALELSRKKDYLSSAEKKYVIEFFNMKIKKELRQLESARMLKTLLIKGIAVHHAGMFPSLKEVVEELFAEKKIVVLYTTETFAVGINMPAKSVCFDSLRKFDGISFRPLRAKEYYQMAGRAGRRGIDTVGWAITVYDRKFNDINVIHRITQGDREKLKSQFELTYNTVLNMILNHEPDEYETILKKSLYYFQQKKKNKNIRIMASFNHLVKKLRAMGYLTQDNSLTQKGYFASRIYSQELLVTEVFFGGLYEKLDDIELNILVGSIAYEPRKKDYFKFPKDRSIVNKILKTISSNNFVADKINKKTLMRLTLMIKRWCEGCDFIELLDYTNLAEGDIIRFFRQIIDYERQILKASLNEELSYRMGKCIDMIQRDVIKVDF